MMNELMESPDETPLSPGRLHPREQTLELIEEVKNHPGNMDLGRGR